MWKHMSEEELGKVGFDILLLRTPGIAFTNWSLAGQLGHQSGLDVNSKLDWRPQEPDMSDVRVTTYDDYPRHKWKS